MRTGTSQTEFYLRWKFVAYQPETGQTFNLTEVCKDVFAQSILISRPLEVNAPSLSERLLASHSNLVVYMLSTGLECKPLDIHYETLRVLAPDLLSHGGGLVIDTVELISPQLKWGKEVSVRDLPLPLRKHELLRPVVSS